MISLDTEVTGIDLRHGARPFFVTTCDVSGEQAFFEWDVDPLTRLPQVPSEDEDAVAEMLLCRLPGRRSTTKHSTKPMQEIVLHNAKFDATALEAAGIVADFPWDRAHDTLTAGHVLSSNTPHDLTSMALQWLGMDIKPHEDELEAAVKEARRIAEREFAGKVSATLHDKVVRQPRWRIAREGLPEMPSAKEKTWRFDYWLPRAVAKALGYDADHPWWTVLRDYANADSATTLKLWLVLRAELERRGLWHVYLTKLGNLPALAEMEGRGVPVKKSELVKLRDEYKRDSAAAKARCVSLAARMRHDLTMPKGSANNRSLVTFAFDVLRLPVVGRTETGQPSLNKAALEEWKKTLDGDQLAFVKDLSAARKRDKAVEYLDSYEHYALPTEDPDWWVLHPNLNATGTDTTRLSCANPNLQQVSRQETKCDACGGEGCAACGGTGEDLHSVRRVFCPRPGREMWTLDAKNIELRIPAYTSKHPDLVALFERPDDPPFYGSQHLLNMSIVYDDIWQRELAAVGIDKVGPHCKKKYAAAEYHFGKCGGLAMQYQCGEETADRAFRRKGGFRRLKNHFKLVDDLNQRYVRHANRHGWVETAADRSLPEPRGYPLVCGRGDRGGVMPTLPLNYFSQGTAGWWMVKAMNRCLAQLREWRAAGCDCWLALTVHDELMFDFPKGKGSKPWLTNLPKVRKLQALMEMGGDDIGIPTPVQVEYHAESWAKGMVV